MLSPSGGVWLVSLEFRPELLEPRWVFNSYRSIFIAVYCVVVLATSCSRTALSLVAADAMLSMSPLKESMNASAGMTTGGGTWAWIHDAPGCTVSPLYEILWMLTAALDDLKESAEELKFRMTRSSASSES